MEMDGLFKYNGEKLGRQAMTPPLSFPRDRSRDDTELLKNRCTVQLAKRVKKVSE